MSRNLGSVSRASPKFSKDRDPYIRLVASTKISSAAAATGLTEFKKEFSSSPQPSSPADSPARQGLPLTPQPNGNSNRQSRTNSPIGGNDGGRMLNDNDNKLQTQFKPTSSTESSAASPVIFTRPEPDDEVPAGIVQTQPAGAGAGEIAVEESAEPKTTWRIPPIRTSGILGYSLRRSFNSDGSYSFGQVLNANIRGSSYIYAPWLATVSGGLGLVTGVDRSVANQNGYESTSTSLVGDANLSFLQSSRYPFMITLARSDSRTAAAAVTSDFTDTRFGFRQYYTSEGGLQRTSFSFDHSAVDSKAGGADTVNAFTGNITAPVGAVTNVATARYSTSERQRTGEGSNLFSVNSSHSYSPEENIALQAFSSLTSSDFYARTEGVANHFRGQFIQLGTSASWQPEFEDEEGYPLGLTGGLTYAGVRTEVPTGDTMSHRLGLNTSANYRLSPQTSTNANGNVNYFVDSEGNTQVLGAMGVGIGYMGSPLTIGKFSYTWDVGATGNVQGGSGNVPVSTNEGVHAGHSLGRNISLSPGETVFLTLAQNVSSYAGQTRGGQGNHLGSLSHSAMASYNFAAGSRFSGAVNSSFSDILTMGNSEQHFKSLTMGFMGTGQVSPLSTASVNLSLYWTDQSQTTSFDGQELRTTSQRMNATGTASYSHSRFAGIPRLYYTLSFVADTLVRDSRLYGDAKASILKPTYSVDNQLSYRIGLLDFRLSGTVTDTLGKKNALLFFQVNRQIGAF